jgi:hypothetical protein
MATNVSTSKFAPKGSGIRDPRSDTGKKNGMFWNPVRFQYLGGQAGAYSQAGTRRPRNIGQQADGQDAVGPISDRGRGR